MHSLNQSRHRGLAFRGLALLALFFLSGSLQYRSWHWPDWVPAARASFNLTTPFPAAVGVATFASDCTTTQTVFNFGATVCAQVTGIDPPIANARFDWVDPDGIIQQSGPNITADGQTTSFVLPSMGANAKAGTWRVNIAYNSDSSVIATASFSVSNCPAITLSPASLPAATAGQPYLQALTPSAGAAPFSFMLHAGSLPAGISLSAGGALSGTPSAIGTFNFTVKVTDNNACLATQSFTLAVNCPSITLSPAALPAGTAGLAYSQQLAVSGAFAGSASFTLLSGALPAGVNLSSSGLLSGTPAQTGNFNFTVKATDALGCMGTQAISLMVNCQTLSLTPASLPNAQAGVAYSQSLSASGGIGAVTFSLLSGALPTGITLSSAGVISGTATALGTSNFTVQATDTLGCLGTKLFALTIACPSFTLSALPAATAGAAYNQTISVSPNVGGPQSFAVTGGALPPGLALAAGGWLSGTPTTAGTFNFTVTATGAGGFGSCSGSRSYSFTVACPAVTLAPVTLPNGATNSVYQQALAASPSGTAYSWAVSSGSLPSGLALNSATGELSGTPTAAGNFSFVIRATGWGSCTGTQAYNLLVTASCAAITVNPATLPSGTVGTAYNQTLSASGGAGPYSFAVTSGALPTGLTLNGATGLLSGTPVSSGAFNFTVTATGAGGCAGTRNYPLTITCAAIGLTPASLPAATAGVAYSQTLAASPADSYSFTLLTGSLPPGLSLNSATGALSGLPSSVGSYNFTVKATGTGGCNGTRAYALTVACPAITVNPASLPGGTVGTAYNQTISATPALSYSFSKTSGSLPPGLSLQAATGVLSGTPTTAGSYNFTIQATAFGTCQGTRAYTVVIGSGGGGCKAINLPDLPNGAVGSFYYGDLSGTTPLGSYSFTVESGSLPPGLAVDDLFVALFGTPTAAGSYNFTLRAARSDGCAGTRAYTVLIGSSLGLVRNDFDGDGKSDLVRRTPGTNEWRLTLSQTGQTELIRFGAASDLAALGDYDGDGRTDLAVYQTAAARWLLRLSGSGEVQAQLWDEVSADAAVTPVPADYDGDGRTELGLWESATGEWRIAYSRSGKLVRQPFGAPGAVAVPADYDGDGRADLAVYEQASGRWQILPSRDGVAQERLFGPAGAEPVVGDYDGDGQADLALWQAGAGTLLRRARTGQLIHQRIGNRLSADEEVLVGDYDGDGKTELAIWQTRDGKWQIIYPR